MYKNLFYYGLIIVISMLCLYCSGSVNKEAPVTLDVNDIIDDIVTKKYFQDRIVDREAKSPIYSTIYTPYKYIKPINEKPAEGRCYELSFNSDKKLILEAEYNGKDPVGTWYYYKNNNLVLAETYQKKVPVEKRIIGIDKNNNPYRQDHYFKYSPNEFLSSDKQKNTKKEETKNPESFSLTDYYIYDYDYEKTKEGILTKIVHYESEINKIDSQQLFEYDKKNRLKKQTFDEMNGTINIYILYDYVEETNRIKSETTYNSNNQVVAMDSYNYNENGNVIRIDHYEEDPSQLNSAPKLVWNEIIIYDSNNRKTKKEHYENNVLSFYDVYKYDENGKLILEENFLGDGMKVN